MKIKIRYILWKISRMKAADVDVVFEGALKAKQRIHPEWDIIYFARKKDSLESDEMLIDFIRKSIEAAK